MSKTIYHNHHIIPRHMGGTDDPSNLVKLTVEEHANAHKGLYEKYGKKEDYWAWKGLAGEIGKEEIIYEMRKENWIKGNKVFIGKLKDPEFYKKWQQAQKDAGVGELGVWGKWNLGKIRSEEAKENYRKAALNRERVPCKHCGKGYTKPNLAKHERSCVNR